MATLYREKPSGSWSIRFIDEFGKRRSVCLLKRFSSRTASKTKQIVEAIIDCRNNHQPLTKRDRAWLETSPVEIRMRLEKVGLIKQTRRWTLAQLWDEFVKETSRDRNFAPNTIGKYGDMRKRFFAYFKEDDPLSALTKQSLQDWKQFLTETYRTRSGKPLALPTISGTLASAKAVCTWATDERELFERNPAATLERIKNCSGIVSVPRMACSGSSCFCR